MAILTKFRKIKNSSRKTVMIRGKQQACLTWMRYTAGWQRITRKSMAYWHTDRVRDFMATRKCALLHRDGVKALKTAIADGLIRQNALVRHAEMIQKRKFDVLHHSIPSEGPWPWHTDWRHHHSWPKKYFQSYNHHAERPVPYDVKYPWEVSRLWFLTGLLQGEALGEETLHDVQDILSDWVVSNPMARTINWHPMEVSMRALSLVQLLDMVVQYSMEPEAQADSRMTALENLAGTLLRSLTQHGEFLYRAVEWSDNRGNHFAANIVALLAIGLALEHKYPAAEKWKDYALRHMSSEIERQFLSDGVNFEKSTAYHFLVTTLFTSAKVMMERHGLKLSPEADKRLHAAIRFTGAVMQPNGKIPLIGDTDDARVFGFDPVHPRNPAALFALGAILYKDEQLKSLLDENTASPVLPWLMGIASITDFVEMTPQPFPESTHFDQGGYIAVREAGGWLVMDVGEVGQNGLGGHGHNDLLSFCLGFEGRALLVDPGCPSYTGDKEARRLYRSTAWHNSIVIDGREMAEMTAPFRIQNTAQPHNVSYRHELRMHRLAAGHDGYDDLPDPVDVMRRIEFNAYDQIFVCHDRLTSAHGHKADRYLHFAPDVVLQEKEDSKAILVSLHQFRWLLTFDDLSTAYTLKGRVSDGYGHQVDAAMLLLSCETEAPTELWFKLQKATI